jgi:hypothetical protein
LLLALQRLFLLPFSTLSEANSADVLHAVGDSPVQKENQKTRNGRRRHQRDVQDSDDCDGETGREWRRGSDGEIKRTAVRWLPSVAKVCLHIGFCKFWRHQNSAAQGVQVPRFELS